MSDKSDTIDTIVDDMLNEGHTGPADSLEWVQAKMKFYAERIKEAWKRQMSQSWHHREMEELILRHEKEVNELKKRQIGNAAAMREALENSNGLLEELSVIGEWGESAREQIAENNAALATPPRNCDVGTADEQESRFEEYCDSNYSQNDVDEECWRCPLLKPMKNCAFSWLQMPYERGIEE